MITEMIFLKYETPRFVRMEAPEAYIEETVDVEESDIWPRCDGFDFFGDVAGDDAADAADITAFINKKRGNYWVVGIIDDIWTAVYCDNPYDFYDFWCHHVLRLPAVIDAMGEENPYQEDLPLSEF